MSMKSRIKAAMKLRPADKKIGQAKGAPRQGKQAIPQEQRSPIPKGQEA